MLVAKMAGKRFQADLPGAPSRRFHSSKITLKPLNKKPFFLKLYWGSIEMMG